ncbi:MAG: hypothetical protein U0575_14800 [Phycisphaerales bacterium]
MSAWVLEAVQPWHGALLGRLDGSAIVSLSPELFLQGTFRLLLVDAQLRRGRRPTAWIKGRVPTATIPSRRWLREGRRRFPP